MGAGFCIANASSTALQRPTCAILWSAKRQPALWLKAIYWDSGVVRTPEQVMVKAYDSMPGVERPDFGIG